MLQQYRQKKLAPMLLSDFFRKEIVCFSKRLEGDCLLFMISWLVWYTSVVEMYHFCLNGLWMEHFQVSLHVLRVVRTCAPLRWIDMLLLVLMFMVHQIGGVDPELLCSTAK